jgi:hypothetical protein
MKHLYVLGLKTKRMNKPLLLFLISVVILVIIALVYHKYCESKPKGCKKVHIKDRETGPVKGIDW